MGSSVTNVSFKNIWGGTAECGASITMCHHNWVVGTLPTPRWANISFADIDLEVKNLGGFVGPSSPTRVPLEYPFVWRGGVLNGCLSTRVWLWDSLMFGRLAMGFANVRAGTRVLL